MCTWNVSFLVDRFITLVSNITEQFIDNCQLEIFSWYIIEHIATFDDSIIDPEDDEHSEGIDVDIILDSS